MSENPTGSARRRERRGYEVYKLVHYPGRPPEERWAALSQHVDGVGRGATADEAIEYLWATGRPKPTRGPSASAKKRERLAERDGPDCHYCLAPAADTLDRVVPGADFGNYDVENLVLACAPCNNGRGHTPYDLWCATKGVSPDEGRLTEALVSVLRRSIQPKLVGGEVYLRAELRARAIVDKTARSRRYVPSAQRLTQRPFQSLSTDLPREG